MRNVDSKLSGEREINKMIMSTVLKNNLFKVHRNNIVTSEKLFLQQGCETDHVQKSCQEKGESSLDKP